MDPITSKIVEQLLNTNAQTCISIFMPAFKKGPEVQQNPIRFGNLIKKARQDLARSGLSNHQIKEQLSQAETLLNNPKFWAHQSIGLATYITKTGVQTYRIPLEVPERVFVGTHLYVKPLLPLVTTNGKFFVLTLSQNDVKLYEATRTNIDKRFLGDIPRSMEEAIESEDFQKYLHSYASKGRGGQKAIFHGQGPGDENIKRDIEEFLNLVENGVTNLLIDEQAPLILAGVEYLTSMYRNINKYNKLLDNTIDGNFDRLGKTGIHQKAWQITRPYFKQNELRALEKFQSLSGTGKTSTDLTEIIPQAHSGRIETLFFVRDNVLWGNYNRAKRTATLDTKKQPQSLDLADLAVFYTLQNGGKAFSLKPDEMIKGTALAATFRY